MLIDAETGAQAGDLLVGQRTSIDLGPHVRTMRPESSYVSVHTHPSDCSFSYDDALLLYRYPAVRCVVVCGVRGTAYALSR